MCDDGHEQVNFAFTGTKLSDVDMKISNGIALELLLGPVTFNLRQAADTMPPQLRSSPCTAPDAFDATYADLSGAKY